MADRFWSELPETDVVFLHYHINRTSATDSYPMPVINQSCKLWDNLRLRLCGQGAYHPRFSTDRRRGVAILLGIEVYAP